MLDLGFVQPVLYDLVNPARGLVDDGAPDFGYTEPTYNGQSALLRRGGPGGNTLAPINVSSTTIQTALATDAHPYTWRGVIQARGQHDISWRIHLPPRPNAGYWEHLVNNGSKLWTVLDHFHDRRPAMFVRGSGSWLTNPLLTRWFGLPGPWYVRMFPRPGVDAFMAHILAHEFQHVEDHAWLAQQIFGPLDDWHEANAGTVFRAYDRNNLFGVQLAGYAETDQRILRYWQQAIVDSGNMFHNTAQGDHPDMRIIRIDHPLSVGGPGVVEIEVQPRIVLNYTGFDLDDPVSHPNRFANSHFRIERGKLGGNEPHLTVVAAAHFRPRTVDYGEAVPGGVLVDEEETDVLGFAHGAI